MRSKHEFGCARSGCQVTADSTGWLATQFKAETNKGTTRPYVENLCRAGNEKIYMS